jgi:hypothetical protein
MRADRTGVRRMCGGAAGEGWRRLKRVAERPAHGTEIDGMGVVCIGPDRRRGITETGECLPREGVVRSSVHWGGEPSGDPWIEEEMRGFCDRAPACKQTYSAIADALALLVIRSPLGPLERPGVVTRDDSRGLLPSRSTARILLGGPPGLRGARIS